MIRPRWFWLALLAACVLPASAIAQITQFAPPNDNELHSAYCSSLLKSQIEFVQNGLAQADAGAKNQTTPLPPDLQEFVNKQKQEMRESLTKLQAAQDTLRAYLLPKLMVLDPVAMALATKRGEADWQAFEAMSDRCGATCSPAKPPDQGACWSSCADTALIKHMSPASARSVARW